MGLHARRHGASLRRWPIWFDARAKLVEIAGQPPATSATTATQAPLASSVSRLSQVSHARVVANMPPRGAEVAIVATPHARTPEPKPSAETFPHGLSFTGEPKTWTGRMAAFADWPGLSEWEEHGPNGRLWNGITRRWE